MTNINNNQVQQRRFLKSVLFSLLWLLWVWGASLELQHSIRVVHQVCSEHGAVHDVEHAVVAPHTLQLAQTTTPIEHGPHCLFATASRERADLPAPTTHQVVNYLAQSIVLANNQSIFSQERLWLLSPKNSPPLRF